MPVNPTYPGVYIEEIPSGVHTITGVATSIGAFIDSFPQGPLDKAVQILSFADFERSFGGLNTNSEASYAIQQFFLNGGSMAYVIRVGGSGVNAAAVNLVQAISGTSVLITVTAGSMIGGKLVNNPGTWGNNIRVAVDYNTATSVPDPTESVSELFNLNITEVDPVTGLIVSSETFRNLTLRSNVINSATDVVNQGSQLVYLSNPASAATPRPLATGTFGALTVPPVIPATGGTFTITVDPDGTATHIPAKPWVGTLTYGATAPADYPSLRPYLEAAIKSATPDPTDLSDVNNPLVAPLLAGASVQLVGNGTVAAPYQFRILAGGSGPNISPNASIAIDDSGLVPALGLKTGVAKCSAIFAGHQRSCAWSAIAADGKRRSWSKRRNSGRDAIDRHSAAEDRVVCA